MAASPKDPAPEKKPRARAEVRIPPYDLADCVKVADLLHKKGGGSASPEHLASYLGYSSTNNGAFLARVSAAKAFGLIEKIGAHLVPTDLAMRILSPIYPDDAKKGLVDAFFNIPVFKTVYTSFRGRELPPEKGLKNALEHQFKVASNRVDSVYYVMMSSAEKAGFFETRGAKTHLIVPSYSNTNYPINPPVLPPHPPMEVNEPPDPGDQIPPRTTQASPSLDDFKAKYFESLMKLFDAKAEKGEFDEKLTERIERLLGLSP